MKVRLSYVWIAIAIVAVGGFLLWKNMDPGTSNGSVDGFAKCLMNKGVVMYGTKYCGHCNDQKKLFGDSFKYINYIECTEQGDICEQNGVTSVPTWVIDGEKYIGKQSLEKLSELSGCEL